MSFRKKQQYSATRNKKCVKQSTSVKITKAPKEKKNEE